MVSTVLAQANIPIYYQASVSDDFILVPMAKIELATEILQSGFV